MREIRFRTTTSGVSEAESVVGYGANLVGGFRLFKSEAKADVLYYQIIAGQGLGRYLVSLSGRTRMPPRPRERHAERRPRLRRETSPTSAGGRPSSSARSSAAATSWKTRSRRRWRIGSRPP